MENQINIDIKGNKGYILGELSREIITQLDDELSFTLAGAEYAPSYKMGMWDGKTRILGRDLTIPLGLITRVKEFFTKLNYKVIITDHNTYTPNTPNNYMEKLASINKVPRAHQHAALQVALEHKRGIIRVATGGGKTLIVAMIVGEVGKRAVVYVIGKELLWQFHEFFQSVFDEKIGVIGDGIVDIQPITIASVWTVGQAFGMKAKRGLDDENDDEKAVAAAYHAAIRKCVSEAEVSILDECHIGAAETIQKIGVAIRSQYTFGLSASPFRDDCADMLVEALFGKVILNISASQLIEQGFLVRPDIRFLPVPTIDGLPKNYKQIYSMYISENRTRNDMVTKSALRLVEQNFVTMVLFKEIEHGKRLYKQLRENINCNMLNGSMDTEYRQKIIDEVKDGKCKLLLASSIFDIGVDIPLLSGLVLAGGGKSSVRALQRIGRVIRAYPGKEKAAIVDFVDQAKYLKDHSKIRKEIYMREPGFNVTWPSKKK